MIICKYKDSALVNDNILIIEHITMMTLTVAQFITFYKQINYSILKYRN